MAGPIRQQINLDSLARYVEQNVPQIKTPLDVKQFGYGQSNPTYLIKGADGQRYVMRKKPPGKLLSKTAHQVDREYKIIHAMESTDVPVPQALCLCQDTSIIGTDFYIMSYLDGRIFEDPSIPDVSPEDRRAMWHSIVTTLGKYHRVKPADVGLEGFGRPSNFYNRQLKTFAKLSVDQANTKDVESGEAVGAIPHYDEMVQYFGQQETQPKDRSTFVHGDYKVDNVVFHKTEPRVIGILDWEMATIGHPLSDLANLLGPFTTAQSDRAQEAGRRNPAFVFSAAPPGLPTKSECIKWYEDTVGWTVEKKEFTWAEAFGIYRGAVIMQGIAARYAVRQASSTKAKDYGRGMGPYGQMAWDFVQEAQRQVEHEKGEGQGYMVDGAGGGKSESEEEKAAGKGLMVDAEGGGSKKAERSETEEEKAAGKGYMAKL